MMASSRTNRIVLKRTDELGMKRTAKSVFLNYRIDICKSFDMLMYTVLDSIILTRLINLSQIHSFTHSDRRNVPCRRDPFDGCAHGCRFSYGLSI